jgi:hypothetical protein
MTYFADLTDYSYILGPVQTTVHFKAYPRGARGNNDPPDFALSATYTSADTLGPSKAGP